MSLEHGVFDIDGNKFIKENEKKIMPVKGSRMMYLKSICNTKGTEEVKDWNKSVCDLFIQLTKKQMMLFLKMNQNTNEYNILDGKVSDIANKIGILDRHSISRMKHALLKAHAIIEYNGTIMVNPFAILPAYDKKDPSAQFKSQQIWRYINYDNDAFFFGIDKKVTELF